MEPPCLANIRDILSARENHRNWEKKENIETEHNEEQTETASHSKTFGRRTSVEKIVVIPELNVVSHLQSEEEDVDSCRQNWSEQDNLQTIHDSSVSIKTEPHMECQSQMMEKCFEDYKIAAESLDNCKTEDMPDTLQNWSLPIDQVDPAKLRSCTSCPNCDFETSDMNLFKEHIESHSRSTVETYNCKVCGLICGGSFHLSKHMKEHADDNLYFCDSCDYTCSEEWQLKNHVKVHNTGCRTFSCSICGYRGPDSWKLRRHMRIHTGEKPYGCSCCNYCSSDSWKVKRHMQVHTRKKNF